MREARIMGPAKRGQALVEFALILPVIVLVVMGFFDLGRGVVFFNMLSDAAREGARVGIAPGNTLSQMCTQVVSQMPAPGVGSSSGCSSIADSVATDFGTLRVTVHKGKPGSTDPAQFDSVTLSYSFQPITPLIGTSPIILGGNPLKPIRSSMYVEQ
jgi:TadE-like protein